jgi:hypothetical protein
MESVSQPPKKTTIAFFNARYTFSTKVKWNCTIGTLVPPFAQWLQFSHHDISSLFLSSMNLPLDNSLVEGREAQELCGVVHLVHPKALLLLMLFGSLKQEKKSKEGKSIQGKRSRKGLVGSIDHVLFLIRYCDRSIDRSMDVRVCRPTFQH